MNSFNNPSSNPELSARIRTFKEQFESVVGNVRKVIVGKDEVVRKVLLALTARGHVLLKDVPGTGKTMLSRAIAASVACDFRRIQFTPDLLPMDITGSNVFNLRSKAFEFSRGPVFTHLLLADEINRATPKTQSALLEVMAERQVTVEGVTYPMEAPFLVIATMNPLDHDGTYALPAAQLDRFTIQLSMGFPSAEAEVQMLDVHLGARPPIDDLPAVIDRATFLQWQDTVSLIYVSDPAKRYAINLIHAIRQDSRALSPPSPRSTLMLVRTAQALAMTQGRDFLLPQDIQVLAPDVLSHRMVVSGDVTAPSFVKEILQRVDVAS